MVVFLVPAHGGGLREAVFPREIPTPRFTHVPAGIKLIAPGRAAAAAARPIVKSESLSYLAVGQVIVSFLRLPPFGPGATQRKEEAVARLPTVDYLGENESARFLWLKDESYVFDKEKKWTKVRSTVLRQEATALPRFGS